MIETFVRSPVTILPLLIAWTVTSDVDIYVTMCFAGISLPTRCLGSSKYNLKKHHKHFHMDYYLVPQSAPQEQ